MARLGEGDNRWIVREREDGRNCNNWHWTTKDVSKNTKQWLAEKLKEASFPSPLELCKILSAEVTGEASLTNRKGRTFLMYELEVKLKWEAELRDSDGTCLQSCTGSMKLPDVNATMLDDLDVEFSSSTREGTLVTAMRKQGVSFIRKLVEKVITELQEEMRAQQNSPATGARPPSATNPQPIPMPLKVESTSKAATAPAAIAAPQSAPPAAAATDKEDDAEDKDDDEAPPPPLAAALKALKKSPEQQKSVQLSNCSIGDCHLKPLVEALHHSQCAVETLDLAFNRLTDAGVHLLFQAIVSGCAMELTHLYLGGNKTSVAGMALSQNLKQVRPDLVVDWRKQLREAKSMCVVGSVYSGSPAFKAGLLTGDSVVAFGSTQHREYKGVTESIVPIVKGSVGKPIDVVVVRVGEGAQVHQVQLTLVPQQWSGGGLLGCILK
uniref:Activator of Hsp90 ATPase AHSA1-like N-terminal domain-containing protein n=2 Tax=Chrysotila carterae TaxID=13221 RepID=A0A7S4B6Z1_CHRCT